MQLVTRPRIDPAQPHLGGNIIGGDPRTESPKLWKWLRHRFEIGSMYDVGCGEGHAMAWFRDQGCIVYGLDGLPENVAAAAKIGPTFLCDLTRHAAPLPRVDFVWCSELVEHVEERYLDNLLSTLACADVVAMTHATPGQLGHHHVNCQVEAYWVQKMRLRGYTLDDDATMNGRLMDGEFFRRTGLVFVR